MMRRKDIILLIVVLLACPFLTHAYTVGKLPMQMTFGTAAERNDWRFLNSNAGTTTWTIGSNPEYAYIGNYMMYMSQDGGNTRTYTNIPNQRMECLAYCPIDGLPSGEYTVDFHYRGQESALYVTVENSEPVSASYGYYYGIKQYSPDLWWHDGKHTFQAAANTTYYLCFRFLCENEKQITKQGWALDYIQIYPANTTPTCAQVPNNLKQTRVGNSAVFSWEGNASEYQVEYFMSDTSANISRTVNNVTSNSFTVSSASVPEGTYNFRVRAICSTDTSAWAALDYQLIYDASLHCFDYLNFYDSRVHPKHGYFYYPGTWDEVMDYGFRSSNSHHTIHHYPRDYDERTNYKLRTFPEGQPAAVRLGNWETGAQAEEIVYTMRVTPDMGVLQLQYALVMQLPNHDSEQQPRFTLEFRDSADNLIDSCGFVDFTAKREGLDTTWHTEHVEGEDDIIWKDWTLVGLNMRDYKGQLVNIHITTKDCSEGQHFGYAYFTLACSRGIIEGTHCGQKPDSFRVDEGFYYRWYHKYDNPRVVLNTDRNERVYYLTDPFDTCTYCVDMINKIDTNCYFTLEASSLAFITHPAATYEYYIIKPCKHFLFFTNQSTTEGVYWDETGTKKVIQTVDSVAEWYWDFGRYGTSTAKDPGIQIDNSGGTVHVELHTYMADRECGDVYAFDVQVPAIGPKYTDEVHTICKGEAITVYGRTYTEPIDDPYTYEVALTGCDSIHTVRVRWYQTDTIREKDLLCLSIGAKEWHGRTLTEAGLYSDTVRSVSCGCDSVIYFLELEVQQELNIAIDYTTQSFCYGEGEVEVPFSVLSGNPVAYDLLFSDTAKILGFKDRINQPVSDTDTKLVIPLSDEVWAGPYEAQLIFHNAQDCDSLYFPLAFNVYYHPDSLITQRWNDFLSVRKSAFDYYGGFYDYQWYQDGKPLAGETSSQLYLPQTGLQSGSAYVLELTRVKDGIRMRTCDFYPAVEPDSTTLIVYPTILPAQGRVPLHVHTNRTGTATLYDHSGAVTASWRITEADNHLSVPGAKGLYMLRILFDSGEVQTRKIIVE